MNESNGELDRILSLQLTMAWAGEALSRPARLGWWKTDLCDEAGGGDLLQRLLPRTWQWAGLEAAREAARRADAAARVKMADPDGAVTLFHFGFHMDERLSERLAEHKRHGKTPATALGNRYGVAAEFDRDALESFVASLGKAPRVETVPGGRQLKEAMPESPADAAARLVCALVPFADAYPLPFYKVAR